MENSFSSPYFVWFLTYFKYWLAGLKSFSSYFLEWKNLFQNTPSKTFDFYHCFQPLFTFFRQLNLARENHFMNFQNPWKGSWGFKTCFCHIILIFYFFLKMHVIISCYSYWMINEILMILSLFPIFDIKKISHQPEDRR